MKPPFRGPGCALFVVALALVWFGSPARAQCDSPRLVEGSTTRITSMLGWHGGEWLGEYQGRPSRWNGAAWEVLPGFPRDAEVFRVHDWNGGLIVAGRFEGAAGPLSVRFWNGSVLARMGGDILPLPSGFIEHQGELYASAPNTAAPFLHWTGAAWEPVAGVGDRPDGVSFMAECNGVLYLATSTTIRTYQDGEFAIVASVSDGYIRIVTPSDEGLIVGGTFSRAGGAFMRGLALWDGAAWRPWDGGVDFRDQTLQGIAVLRGVVHMAGSFFRPANAAVLVRTPDGRWEADTAFAQASSAQASPTDLMITTSDGRYFGSPGRWSRFDSPMLNGDVADLAVLNGELYASGTFTAFGNVALNRLARRGPFGWEATGEGLDQPPSALAAYGGTLYAAGIFALPGVPDVVRLVRMDGAGWTPISVSGGPLNALAVFGGELLLGGSITAVEGVPVQWLGAWNGRTARAFPGAFNGQVSMCKVVNGELYAGGAFRYEGARLFNRIARWDGSQWQPLGSGLDGVPGDAAWYNGRLYVCGGFRTAGGVSSFGIAAWDGSQWTAFPRAFHASSALRELEVFDGRLWIAGMLYDPNREPRTMPAASWDGAQLRFYGAGSGFCLEQCGGDLHIGAVAQPSPYTRLGCPCEAPRIDAITGVAGARGEPATLEVVASSASPVRYQWRRNGVDIPLATGPTLSVDRGFIGPDAGFDCLVLNPCGSSRAGPILVRECLADFSGDGFLDWVDFAAFWDAFEAGSHAADLNGDAFVDFFDVIGMYDLFERGC